MIRFLTTCRHEAEIISGIRCNAAADDRRHLAPVIAPARSIHEPTLHAAHPSDDRRSNARRIPSSCRSALPSSRKLDHTEAFCLLQTACARIRPRHIGARAQRRSRRHAPIWNSPVLRVQLPSHLRLCTARKLIRPGGRNALNHGTSVSAGRRGSSAERLHGYRYRELRGSGSMRRPRLCCNSSSIRLRSEIGRARCDSMYRR
ncbi:hypothetical protein BGLT_05820 [Caballeronia glathei]|nr:hypothetical protein BGLT_05820 [Caballeronia glathei]